MSNMTYKRKGPDPDLMYVAEGLSDKEFARSLIVPRLNLPHFTFPISFLPAISFSVCVLDLGSPIFLKGAQEKYRNTTANV